MNTYLRFMFIKTNSAHDNAKMVSTSKGVMYYERVL